MTTLSLPAGAASGLPDASLPNPFSRPVVDGPRDALATVESIHRAELDRLVRVFEELARLPVPRLQAGPLALLVQSQMRGSGKSHLLGRLWRVLNGRAVVIFLRAHQDRHAFWRRILERLVQELEYPEATDQRALAPGHATQLDSLARHLLADLLDRSMKSGRIKASEQFCRLVRNGSPQAIAMVRQKLPNLMFILDSLVAEWMVRLQSAGLRLERDAGAWLKVLVHYTLHQTGEAPRQLALAWLQGHELEPEEARLLSLTASQQRVRQTGGDSEESLNESAFQCVKDLCALSAFFRPVVFAFDQTEIYGQSPELARAFGATVARIQAECINQLTVVTCNEQPWQHALSRHFEQADLDRFDYRRPILLKGIERVQAVELVTVKMRQAGYTGPQINAFVARPWLARLFAGRAAGPMPAREIEQAACQALRIGISNGLVCEKPGKPDSALGGQPMPAWMAWNWRLGRCLVWIRPALTARLALVGP